MSDKKSIEGFRGSSGKYKQPYTQPLDNPEIPDKKDWWDDMCKAAGEKNLWDKQSKKKRKK